MFLALAILYPNDRLSGFVMATKTCRAAKLYQRPLNSMRSLSVLTWTSESEYFGRSKIGSKKKCRLINIQYIYYVYGTDHITPCSRMRARGNNYIIVQKSGRALATKWVWSTIIILILAIAMLFLDHLFIFCLNGELHSRYNNLDIYFDPISAAVVYSQSSTFHCQPSSDQSSLVYTPNIPDFYFDHVNVGSSSVTDIRASAVYVYPVSEDRDCSGTVVAIELCYRGFGRNLGSQQSIFTLIAMNQVGLRVTPYHRVLVMVTPTNGNCVPSSGVINCCDIMHLSNSQQFQLPPPTSLFAYGLEYQAGDITPLAFTSSYRVTHFTGPFGFMFLNLVSGMASGLPVMRLLVEGMYVSLQ